MKESSESIAYKEANDIINHIVNICEIDVKNDDDRVFSLEFIRDLLTLYKGSSKDSAARIISTWNLPYAIENDQIKDGKCTNGSYFAELGPNNFANCNEETDTSTTVTSSTIQSTTIPSTDTASRPFQLLDPVLFLIILFISISV